MMDKLRKIFDEIKLNKDEIKFINWIAGWDSWTIQQFIQIINKCRVSKNFKI